MIGSIPDWKVHEILADNFKISSLETISFQNHPDGVTAISFTFRPLTNRNDRDDLVLCYLRSYPGCMPLTTSRMEFVIHALKTQFDKEGNRDYEQLGGDEVEIFTVQEMLSHLDTFLNENFPLENNDE